MVMSKYLIGFFIGGFRRTQYIPELGMDYNFLGFYLEGSDFLEWWD